MAKSSAGPATPFVERRRARKAAASCLTIVAATLVPPAALAGDSQRDADRAFASRFEGAVEDRAKPGPIDTAIVGYREALDGDPGDLAVRDRLLAAIYFKGEFVVLEDDERSALFEQATTIVEQGLDQLADQVGGRKKLDKMDPYQIGEAYAETPYAAPMFFWGAVHWGLWGETHGRITAARKGVAKKIRDLALSTAAIDETYEFAGGYRFLGRLHTEAPKIPLFTGWVDHDASVEYLELAVDLSPDEPLNLLFLAEALLAFRPDERARALVLLEDVAERQPRSDHLLEDRRTLAQAREQLAKIDDE